MLPSNFEQSMQPAAAGLSAGPYSAGRKELGVTELCVCKTFTLTNAGLACYDAGNSEKGAL